MQILLQILAIIGIILLCIIGVILLLLILVLFVPVRYKAEVQKESDIIAHIQATWLFHFLKIQFFYPEPGRVMVRVLGIKVWENKTEEQEDVSVPEKITETDITEHNKVHSNETVNERTVEKTKSVFENETKEEKHSIFQKIQYKIKNIYVKIKKVIEDLGYYKDLLQEKENRLLFERCKQRIFKILKHIKPRVLKADIRFGTGEPDTTGYILALYGMFLSFIDGQIEVTPDFEEKILEGRLYVRGRITAFNLLYNVVRIYFDEQLHVLFDKCKRKDV